MIPTKRPRNLAETTGDRLQTRAYPKERATRQNVHRREILQRISGRKSARLGAEAHGRPREVDTEARTE